MGSMFSAADGGSVGLYMDDKPTFDIQTGFDHKRKVRAVSTTEEGMMSAKIPHEFRDYCVDQLLEYHKCRHREVPLLYRCAHEKHVYLNCEHEDYVMRMKEFEREKRLRIREQRLAGAA